jgi:hypothetical protein
MNTFYLAQAYETTGSGGGAVGVIGLILYFAIIIGVLAGVWKTFVKAGKPGWACIIPIYNMIVLLEIVQKPIWWFLLMLIPFVNIVIAFIVMIELAKSFGKGTGFGLGLIFLSPIFWCILGYGDATYQAGTPETV